MKKISIYLAVAIATILTSCGTSNKVIIPTSKTLPIIEDNYSIIWVGSGESYIYSEGEYVRNESHDYSFEVVQRRYGNQLKICTEFIQTMMARLEKESKLCFLELISQKKVKKSYQK